MVRREPVTLADDGCSELTMPQSLQSEKQTFLVVDDHALVLGGTLDILKQAYPEATILTAQTAQDALKQMEQAHPDLEHYPKLNLVVQSAHVRTLVWLKPTIDNHTGGFTVVDKSQPVQDLLTMVDWALRERTYTPKEIRNGLQLKPAWMQVLQLAFQESLQDTAIAKRMNVSERTVQYYWTKIRDVLEVYPDENKNLRIQTEVRARETGLLD